MKFVET